MANKFEGGGISHPAPRSNPGGKTRTAPKRGQKVAPRRNPSSGGAIAGGRIGQKVGQSKPKSSGRSSGGGGGGGGGGYATSNGMGNMSLAAPAPPVPDINSFLSGDDTYQSQQAALIKALANYRSQMGERQDEYNADFTNRLGDLNLAENRSTTDQMDDFAGRGMYISGLYGKARGDLEQDFNHREADMNMAKNQFMSGLNRDFVNFQEENDLAKQKAKSDALQRRSLQYAL